MGNKPKVLIVDDDHELHLLYQSIYKKFIQDDMFELLAFHDGKQCLQYLENLSNIEDDIFLFSDLMMPVMDGFEFIQKIKDLYPKLKIWIVSAFDEPSQLEKAKALGFDNFLEKPLSAKMLTKILNSGKSQK